MEEMDSPATTCLWEQFGAAMDMLANAITLCPEDLWERHPRFHYLAYHTIFFTDYYLSDTPMEKEYQPPPPFAKSEFEDDTPPPRIYRQSELLSFLAEARRKLREQLAAFPMDELLVRRFVSEYKDMSLFELLLYNMRHVQHHAAQLNLLLRQEVGDAPRWVSRTKQR
jgi:hypothetical protein